MTLDFNVKSVKVQWHKTSIVRYVMTGSISNKYFVGDFLVRKGVKTPLEVKFTKANLIDEKFDPETRAALAGLIKYRAKNLIKQYIQGIPDFVKIE